MMRRLDSIVRSSRDDIAQMPLRVTDEDWLEKLDELEVTPLERPRKSARWFATRRRWVRTARRAKEMDATKKMWLAGIGLLQVGVRNNLRNGLHSDATSMAPRRWRNR